MRRRMEKRRRKRGRRRKNGARCACAEEKGAKAWWWWSPFLYDARTSWMHAPRPFSHRFTWKNLKGRFFTLGAAKLILMNVKLPSFYVPSCCKERGVRCVRRKEKEKLEPPLSRANSTAISSKRIRITDLIFIAFNLFSRPPILRSLISRGRKKCVVDSRWVEVEFERCCFSDFV